MAYSVGEKVKGIVNNVTNFGAFVLLEDGSVGMVHISKLSKDFVGDIHSVIKKGDEVTATVISDKDGKIALSMIGDQYNKKEKFGFEPKKEKIPMDFESMLSSFKSASDEKLNGLNRRDKKKRR